MGFLSSIASLFSSIPWVKMGVLTVVVSGIVYGVHVIKLSGEQSQEIIQMKKDTAEQQKEDQAAIQALKDQYARDTQAMQKEKDDAVKIARDTQQQLDRISHVRAASDGPTRLVVSDTLSWMRGHGASGDNQNTENKSTAGITHTSPKP